MDQEKEQFLMRKTLSAAEFRESGNIEGKEIIYSRLSMIQSRFGWRPPQ